ncbi:hypothetical protein WSM22_27160 [Cytophagales bacterium WSM2-2]|nr:hypothetical protein WSM22_27160 [Cytophagales bacterium WSM2-2]
MTKFLNALSLVVILIIAGLSSCHKDDPKPSAKAGFIAKTWKFTGYTIDGTDLFQYVVPCDKDDLQIFTKDGKFSEDKGPLKCDPAEPQTASGTWALSSNDTKLTLVHAGGTIELFDVFELSATTMKRGVLTSQNGTTIKLEFTYTAQ